MLTLSRKHGEKIRVFVGGVVLTIVVTHIDRERGKVSIGIQAPAEAQILREELLSPEQRKRVEAAS